MVLSFLEAVAGRLTSLICKDLSPRERIIHCLILNFSVNQTDDTVLIPELSDYFKTAMPSYFGKDWGPEKPGEGLTRTWVGSVERFLEHSHLF